MSHRYRRVHYAVQFPEQHGLPSTSGSFLGFPFSRITFVMYLTRFSISYFPALSSFKRNALAISITLTRLVMHNVLCVHNLFSRYRSLFMAYMEIKLPTNLQTYTRTWNLHFAEHIVFIYMHVGPILHQNHMQQLCQAYKHMTQLLRWSHLYLHCCFSVVAWENPWISILGMDSLFNRNCLLEGLGFARVCFRLLSIGFLHLLILLLSLRGFSENSFLTRV